MNRDTYEPGAATGGQVQEDGEELTLILVRELRHSPAKVWKALTDPKHLREWAPFDADRNLGSVGTATLTTVGAPKPLVSESLVKQADAPRVLELTWGGQDLRWELEPVGSGTRLTLWHNINRDFIAMGAAGWHICLDVLDHLLDREPLGRIVGADALKFGGWQRLNAEYAKQFGIEPAAWPNPPKN
ncbi:MAG: SRPBCC family protein [Acidobacteriota bacterium]